MRLSVSMSAMISAITCFHISLIFILISAFQGQLADGKTHLPFLPTNDGIRMNHAISQSLGFPDSNGVRKTRQVASVLTLLWPQVVGPIDHGYIKEESFQEVPKMPIEHQLDVIRKKSVIESATRQHVRDLLNNGLTPDRIGLQQLRALHDDISLFYDRHHHHQQNHHHHPLQIHPGMLHIN